MIKQKFTIRSEEHKDYKDIVSFILRSFNEGTEYSDRTDIIALVKEMGYKGITIEGDFNFYNKVGFKTSSGFEIFPTREFPLKEL